MVKFYVLSIIQILVSILIVIFKSVHYLCELCFDYLEELDTWIQDNKK